MTTETTTQSWGSRVGDSFKGILIGFALIAISIGALFWNEGRTIKRTKALAEGAKNVVEANIDSVDATLEGKLVHLSGDAVTDEILVDPFFNVYVKAIKLARKVEIYQWEEEVQTKTERGSGGQEITTKTYSYHTTWSEELIDSSRFKEASGHQNPTDVPVRSETFVAQNVTLGAFSLSKALIDKTGPEAELAIPSPPAESQEQTSLNPIEENIAPEGADSSEATDDDQAPAELDYLDADTSGEYEEEFTPSSSAVQGEDVLNGFIPRPDGFYKGTPENAQIGDIRVTYTYVPSPTPISVVSQQSGNTFVPYQAKTGTVELLNFGAVSAEEMFSEAQKANKFIAWLIRLGGFILMYVGFSSVFRPLSVLADIIPFAGKIVGYGTGAVAFCLALCVSLLTIAVGWISYRPLIAIPLVVVAIGAFVYPFIRGSKKNANNLN